MYTIAALDLTSVLIEHGATSIDVALKRNLEVARIDMHFQT